MTDLPSGYASRAYAHTCAHLGAPRALRRSGVSVLVRRIAGESEAADACAPYPLLATDRWNALALDLAEQKDLVSFVGVVDPLGTPPASTLSGVFPDHLRAFKTHYVAHIDPARPLAHVAGAHRRKAERASSTVRVEVALDPARHAFDWVRLYGALRARHALSEPADFSDAALAAQLELPDLIGVIARAGETVVSMSLWIASGASAHYHLGASDPEGYAAGASFATFACAFSALAERGVRVVDLGGAAGGEDASDGLARFKQGWATERRIAWLGGRVLDPVRYSRLSGPRSSGDYFPAYRAAAAA